MTYLPSEAAHSVRVAFDSDFFLSTDRTQPPTLLGVGDGLMFEK